MKFFIPFILSFISHALHAQMILPPELDTLEQRHAFAEQLVKEMPILVTNPQTKYPVNVLIQDEGMIDMINKLVSRLRQDPRYMAMAAARPAPMTFAFYTVKTERRSQVTPTDEFVSDLQTYYRQTFGDLAKENLEEFSRRIETRMDELIDAAAAGQTTGIMAGLAQIFPPEARRRILGQKTLAERVDSMRAALEAASLAQLRESFDSERFGIPRARLTKSVALKLLEDAVARERELIYLISMAELLNREKIEPEMWSGVDIEWMTAEGKEVSGFLESRAVAAKLSAAFFAALKAQARSSYASSQVEIEVEVPDKKFIVKEVPPHVAVFRGCVSGDCSTTHSWAYPFSPMERNYFVYDETNPDIAIGHVTANVLEVEGVKTFMIRDLVGRDLARVHIGILIQGFAASLPYLGASQLTITNERFAEDENIYPHLHVEITRLIKDLRPVVHTFLDDWIRMEYLDPVVTQTHYDQPARHRNGRLYESARMERLRVPIVRSRIIEGAAAILDVPGRRLSQKEILERIRYGYLANNPMLLDGLKDDYQEWNRLFAILRNENGLTVNEYYTQIESEFGKIGIRLSKSIQRDFPDLFFAGHMRASDAFESETAAGADRTFELLMNRYTLSQDANVLEFAEDYREQLFLSAPFLKAVNTYLTRQRPQDEGRMKELWSFGYRFDLPMTVEQFQFLATHAQPEDPMEAIALMERAMERGDARFTDTDIPKPLLNLVLELLDNSKAEDETPSIRAAAILAQLTLTDENVLKEVKRSVKDEDNPRIRFPLAVALLRSGQDLDSNSAALGYDFVTMNLENNEIPAAMIAEARATLASMPEGTKEMLAENARAYLERKAAKRRKKEACEAAVTEGRPRR